MIMASHKTRDNIYITVSGVFKWKIQKRETSSCSFLTQLAIQKSVGHYECDRLKIHPFIFKIVFIVSLLDKLKGLKKRSIWCVTSIRIISNDGSLFVPQMDEDAMASMLADFVACPPDEEDGASGSNQS